MLHGAAGSSSDWLQILGGGVGGVGIVVRNFECHLGHITFVGIDHEIHSTIILPFSRFKKGSCQ